MPLPTKPGAKRQTVELRPRDIEDPGFVPGKESYTDDEGKERTRETQGTARVYLRPLLSIEIDKADAAAQEFIARYITGGFIHPTAEKWQDKPDPILVDGEPVELTPGHAVRMHRYEAMQRPMKGNAPADQVFVTVDDMVRATVQHDRFWRGLEAFADEVWREGESGKAWARSDASAPLVND